MHESTDGRLAKLNVDIDPHGEVVDVFGSLPLDDGTLTYVDALGRARYLRSQAIDLSGRCGVFLQDLGRSVSPALCVELVAELDHICETLERVSRSEADIAEIRKPR